MAFAHIWRALAALLLAVLLPWHTASAQALQPVPALTARLIDQTQTLSPEQAAAIESRLREIEEKSGSQVVVLMVPSTSLRTLRRMRTGWPAPGKLAAKTSVMGC